MNFVMKTTKNILENHSLAKSAKGNSYTSKSEDRSKSKLRRNHFLRTISFNLDCSVIGHLKIVW